MATKKLANLIALALSATFVLTSCGEGGNPSSPTTPVGSQGTIIRFSGALPVTATATVSSVSSVIDSGGAGEPIDIPDLPSGESTLVIASDSSDNIIFATEVSSGSPPPEFSSDGTAVVFVKIAGANIFSKHSATLVNSAIGRAPELQNLKTLVRAAHNNGQDPLDFPNVPESILATLSQAVSALGPVGQQSALQASNDLWPEQIAPSLFSHAAFTPTSLTQPSLEIPLPAKVFSGGPRGLFSVKVTGVFPQLNGIRVQNGFPINFAAKTARVNDPSSVYGNLTREADGELQKLLPAAELLSVISPDPEIGMAGDGTALNLTIFRTPFVQTQDSLEILQAVFNLSLDALGADLGDCSSGISTKLFSQTPIVPWAHKGADSAFEEFKDSFGKYATWKDAVAVLSQCAPRLSAEDRRRLDRFTSDFSDTRLGRSAVPFMRKNGNFITKLGKRLSAVLQIAEVTYDASSIAAKAALSYQYWDYSKTISVCLARSSSAAAIEIANCATVLGLDQPDVNSPVRRLKMIPGEVHLLDLTAYDINRVSTLVPPKISYTVRSSPVSGVDASAFVSVGEAGDIQVNGSAPPSIDGAIVEIEAMDRDTGAVGLIEIEIRFFKFIISQQKDSITGYPLLVEWNSPPNSVCTASQFVLPLDHPLEFMLRFNDFYTFFGPRQSFGIEKVVSDELSRMVVAQNSPSLVLGMRVTLQCVVQGRVFKESLQIEIDVPEN